MEITYLNGASATSIASSLAAASAAVRLTAPHAVSASRGELCPQVPAMRPRAMELGAGTGAAARWVDGSLAAVRVQHQISALARMTDVDAAVTRDAIDATNGFAKHHPGSETLRPPV